MRFVLLSALIASLVLIVNCQSGNPSNDDDTANFVLESISNKGTSTTVRPREETTKLNLNEVTDAPVTYCHTRDDRPGTCVPFHRCTPQNKRPKGTRSRSQPSFKRNLCPSYTICCNDEDLEVSTKASNNLNNPNNKPTTPSNKVITTRIGAPNQECGMNNSGAFKNVLKNPKEKGPASDFAEFPWMVAILKKSEYAVWSQSDYVGGGTLIHPSVVMTAAHKLAPFDEPFQANQLKCRAGEWDTQTDLEPHPHQERDVQKFIVHADYYRTSLYNDIALLILEQSFQLEGAPHIGTGCLAPSPPAPGQTCYSMGWGRIDPKDPKKYASVLKKVRLHPIQRNECQGMLRTYSRLGRFFEVHPSLTCASGDANVDSCRGDGGSPLVCNVPGDKTGLRFAVHGMVVYGTECFDPNIPGMYADTAHLKSWIDDRMREEGFGAAFYTI